VTPSLAAAFRDEIDENNADVGPRVGDDDPPLARMGAPSSGDGRLPERRQTVDFTIPEVVNSSEGVIYVPVAVLEKETLRDFDLRYANRAALPMLTLRQNAKIAKEMLDYAASRSLGPSAVF
jgi:hypothetical protein